MWQDTWGIPPYPNIALSEGFTLAVTEEISDDRWERGRQKEKFPALPLFPFRCLCIKAVISFYLSTNHSDKCRNIHCWAVSSNKHFYLYQKYYLELCLISFLSLYQVVNTAAAQCDCHCSFVKSPVTKEPVTVSVHTYTHTHTHTHTNTLQWSLCV